MTVLFVNLDRLKTVNDSLGHAAGDRVIVAAGRRLATAVRPADTVACWGGDEFVVLCDDLEGLEQTSTLVKRLQDSLAQPIVVDDVDVTITASIGVTRSDRGASSGTQSLLQHADTAMYRAKERGRDRYELYDEVLRISALDSLRLETQLRQVLASPDEQLVVHYQPIVELASRRIVGAEALIRWQHPDLGLLQPDALLPIAEESNLILALGSWVLRRTCLDAVALRAEHPGDALTMALNVAPRQLGRRAFAEELREALTATELPPEALCLEITESTLMNVIGSARADLPALRDLGVSIAVDDFGVGYSSLAYLAHFPINVLKIDRSFVAGLPDESALTAAVIALGAALELTTVAEGVERADQEDRLAQHRLPLRPRLPALATRAVGALRRAPPARCGDLSPT
ncbi:MAG: bifunctional diguanylate cyclase/phosphodiesterase [Actinomycetota bacterium]|nr:bifunctional diguanylate cyclase/phosphodiesterase [Actinomycetota bacterium]